MGSEEGTGRPVALGWVDADLLTAQRTSSTLEVDGWAPAALTADLLRQRPRRSPVRPAVVLPVTSVLALAVAYVLATLLWPLSALPPTVTVAAVPAVEAPVASPAWPEEGAAAVGVDGIDATASTGEDPVMTASITKVVTALMVLDRLPLEPGESGPEYPMTSRDRAMYWSFLARDESALDVPVGESLSEYQLLQGFLIASAGNYGQRLTSELWPTDEVFARAATDWLARHGLSGITVTGPTGIGEGNVAEPASLIALGQRAMADPVFAEIVGTREVEIPGAGLVVNTNALLEQPGVIGIKTGSLWGHYNLLAAREVPVGDEVVTVYAAALGQPDDEMRAEATDALLERTAAEVAVRPALPAGTTAGTVTTRWGATSEVVTDAAASVILWNAASAEVAVSITLDEARTAGDAVGTVAVTGPLDTARVGLELASDIAPPDAWWRLTHPLQLWGLAD